jgi:hypothetical protein
MPSLYFHPEPLVDPSATPVLPRWHVPGWVHQQQHNFIWENLPVIAEPESTE